MNLFGLVAIIITVTAWISYINYKFIKLPNVIGVMVISLIGAFALVEADRLGLDVKSYVSDVYSYVGLNQTLVQGLLGFVLFAGAMQISWTELARNKAVVILLATLGVAISAFVFGTGIYFLFKILDFNLSYAYCLLFGAILAPTDPVAVLAVMKSLTVPRHLEVEISGESLFNDGFGIVLFIILIEIVTDQKDVTFGYVALFFIEEALGGAALGFLLALLVKKMMSSIDNYQVEILLSLSLVMGCYALAEGFHISAPIAASSAGLVIGSRQETFLRSQQERNYLAGFWEVVDWLTLTVLFVILGMEILVIPLTLSVTLAGLAASVILLLARWISVASITGFLKPWRTFMPHFNLILTWGGLRGGIPVALALSMPYSNEKNLIISLTYIIVIFSIVVQGLTMKSVLKRCVPEPGADKSDL